MEENKPIIVNDNDEWLLKIINGEESDPPNEALKKAYDRHKRIIMNSEKKEETD